MIFYFVVNLYHRALYVLRNYRYLAGLEAEIRKQLGVTQQSVAFTREGAFYWTGRSRLQGAVKWCYIILLGGLLFAFLGGRIYQDIMTNSVVLAVVDLTVSLAIGLFFLAYAHGSVTMDTAETILSVGVGHGK